MICTKWVCAICKCKSWVLCFDDWWRDQGRYTSLPVMHCHKIQYLLGSNYVPISLYIKHNFYAKKRFLEHGLLVKLKHAFESLMVLFPVRYCFSLKDSCFTRIDSTSKNETEEMHCGRAWISSLGRDGGRGVSIILSPSSTSVGYCIS